MTESEIKGLAVRLAQTPLLIGYVAPSNIQPGIKGNVSLDAGDWESIIRRMINERIIV